MSSVFGLNVTPKNVICLFLILFPKIVWILFVNIFFLFSFDFTTVLTIVRSVLKFLPVSIKALVSLGKQDPP